jgi:tetratricopeptide (TPR) repeat protein
MRRRAVFAVLATAASLASLASLDVRTARADTPPSVWDRARDPDVETSYRLHVEVERRLAQRGRFDIGESQALTARAMLERANAATSPDVRLRFDLGYVYLVLQEYGKSAEVLKSALAMAPNHPAAEENWLRLAFACGHVGDHECERHSYVEVLRRATEDVPRATPVLNLAETEMHMGNLKEAVLGYREALRIAGHMPAGETAPLAVWGLAVALDRSGERVEAERQARFAQELERSMGMRNLLRSTDVFFVPDYEINWYEGLGAAARAREATSVVLAARLWRAAEASFREYVQKAEPAKDRWLDLAKARLATASAEREKAEKRAAKAGQSLDEGEELQF